MSITTETIKEYLGKIIELDDIEDFDDHTPLFSSGLLDSFSLVELVSLIESEAHIKVGPMDISLNNFDSIENIFIYLSKTETNTSVT